jgi:hypothetical protein
MQGSSRSGATCFHSMPDPAIADKLGAFVMFALLAATTLFALWLPLMRLTVTRQIAAGTMEGEKGAALLRRLNSGLLLLILGSAFFSAPFSPFGLPNSHVLAVATMTIEICALAVYLWIMFATRQIG